MFTVDCQSHVFPREYAELLLGNAGWVRTRREGGGYRISYGDLQQFALDPQAYSLQRKLAEMDRAGIDAALLSINIPGPELLEAEAGVRGARMINDAIAGMCSRHPGRLFGLASLPLQEVAAAMEELERAVDGLGLRGAVLYSHLNGRPVDADDLEPFYEAVERLGVPLVIHPTVPTWGEVLKDHSMIPMIGLMVDHSIAMLRLILGGVLERHPRLLVVHPHCGGVIPYLMPRIEEQTEVKRRGREHIRRTPGEYYRRVYLDVVSPSAQAMRYAYEFSGPDRLLFGSDHPWVRFEPFLDCLNSLGLARAEREKILGGNARRLFRLD